MSNSECEATAEGRAVLEWGTTGMRRPMLAMAAGLLSVLLVGAFVPPSGVRASADDVAERLGDCQDDEIENEERAQICSRLIEDASLPEDIRALIEILRASV